MGLQPLRINLTIQKIWTSSGIWILGHWNENHVACSSSSLTFLISDICPISHHPCFAICSKPTGLNTLNTCVMAQFELIFSSGCFTLLPFTLNSSFFSVNTNFLTPPFLSLSFSSFMSLVINVSHCQHLSGDTLTGVLTFTKCVPPWAIQAIPSKKTDKSTEERKGRSNFPLRSSISDVIFL